MIPRVGLIVDNFAGGGGASLGIEQATWAAPDIAINHDPIALGLHATNHPHTRHIVEDVWAVDPRQVTAGRPVALAWFSPDCKHFSKAKGGRPVEKQIRGLAWVVVRWAVAVKPAVIVIENVEEFQTWGPLNPDGQPCPERKGRTFELFVHRLRQAGYVVEWRELKACDYGAPTTRKRLFLIARRDGRPIRWPAATHGDPRMLDAASGRLKPWRTAAECIDWSRPCPSIFERERPLADKTLARIARGVKRFVIDAGEPFIVPVTHSGDLRGNPVSEPLRTITGANRGEHALVTAFMAQHNEGMVGHAMTEPVSTITAKGSHQQLVAAFLTKFYGTCRDGIDMRTPFPTVTAGGWKVAEVRAFLMKYYGTGGQLQGVGRPMHTLTAKARLGLVTVAGSDWQIVDIGMRMLTPRELFRAQGFPDSYVIDRLADGTPVTKTDQIRLCGNSVSPPCARAILEANFVNEIIPQQQRRKVAA